MAVSGADAGEVRRPARRAWGACPGSRSARFRPCGRRAARPRARPAAACRLATSVGCPAALAERRPKHAGLERVLGTGALFSTAYGNVGSSIYYALGLVAVFALGMTPIVFLIAGLIFVCTAISYTEATTMFPEAGGSSSFARHAFNELAAAVTAWGQMLNYIITVAISAFFLPHYLGVVWDPLLSAPADILVGIGDRKSTRLNSSHLVISYAVFCL